MSMSSVAYLAKATIKEISMEPFGSHLRTSQSHPLIIDTIKAANGALGLTFCPGKRQHESMTGGWNRDLDTDLKAIHNWGADIVISLMERFEYRKDLSRSFSFGWIYPLSIVVRRHRIGMHTGA
jgi:hypothetical protein